MKFKITIGLLITTLMIGTVFGSNFAIGSFLPPGYIDGYVTNSITGSPISGASVVCDDDSDITDSNGFYHLVITPPPNCHDVTFSKSGYYSETHNICVASQQTTYWNEALVPIPQNFPPYLQNGYVTPTSGTTTTTFSYYVEYIDEDGDSPSVHLVYIDGISHSMSFYNWSHTVGHFELGASYRYQTTLSAGTHNYKFEFNDGFNHQVFLPASGTYSGPTVTGNNQPPTKPSISGPIEGYVNVEYTFTASSTDPEGDSIQYRWNFDGTWGSYSSSNTAKHTWTTTGSKTIKAQARDEHGAESLVATSTIYISPSTSQPPTTPTISGPSSGNVNVEYTFTASSTDPNGDSIQYRWNFDGTWGSYSSSNTAKHTWTTTGSKTVKAQAKDEHGLASEEGTKTITISDGSNFNYWALILVPFPDDEENYGGVENHINDLENTLCSGGWQSDHIKVLYKCRLNDFKGSKGMGWLESNVKSGDKVMIWIYTHGHGFSAWIFDITCFLELRGLLTLTKNMDLNWLFADALNYDVFDRYLNKLASQDLTIVLNACHSGFGIDKLKKDNRIILAACGKNEKGAGWGFPAWLKRGFDGWADLEPFGGNNNGYVSSEEAFNFALQHLSIIPQIGDYYPGENQIVKLPNDNLDQYQKEGGYSMEVKGTKLLAQSFKPKYSVLTRLSICVSHQLGTEPLYVSIRQGTENGGPASNDLVTREITLDGYSLEAWYELNIDLGNLNVNPEQTYYIVCRTNSDSEQYKWHGTDDTSLYTKGDAWCYNGNIWYKLIPSTYEPPYDFGFFTFGK